MRSSAFLISLALVLCISSVSAETSNLIEGFWSEPTVRKNSEVHCCVPRSIKITCSIFGSCTANYNYYDSYLSSSVSTPCWNMFVSLTDCKLKLYGNDSDSDSYYSENLRSTDLSLNFDASEGTGSPRLNIYFPSSSGEQCDFTMTERIAPRPNYTIPIIGVVVFVIIACCCSCLKKYQSKQANLIIAQNTAEQPSYIAPNQFPNTQVQFGGNAQFPNAQVNMNMNFGANNGQQNF